MRLFSAFLSTILTPLVAVMPLRAELAVPVAVSTSNRTAAITPDQANSLKIRLADGSKSTVEANSIVTGYAIQVTDSSGLAVPDAAVAIRLPEDGATGFFVNGEHSAVAYTDSAGIAKFPQVNWGSTTGSLSIRVTAVKGELHAGALIEQTVVTPQTGQGSPSSPVAPFPSVDTPHSQPATSVIPAPAPAAAAPQQSEPAPISAPAARAKMPGVPTSVAAIHSGAAPDQQPTGTETTPSSDSVSVVNTSGSKGGSNSTKKWVILAAVLGAAGVGAALSLAGKGGGATTATAASTTTSIGAPTISIGH